MNVSAVLSQGLMDEMKEVTTPNNRIYYLCGKGFSEFLRRYGCVIFQENERYYARQE